MPRGGPYLKSGPKPREEGGRVVSFRLYPSDRERIAAWRERFPTCQSDTEAVRQMLQLAWNVGCAVIVRSDSAKEN